MNLFAIILPFLLTGFDPAAALPQDIDTTNMAQERPADVSSLNFDGHMNDKDGNVVELDSVDTDSVDIESVDFNVFNATDIDKLNEIVASGAPLESDWSIQGHNKTCGEYCAPRWLAPWFGWVLFWKCVVDCKSHCNLRCQGKCGLHLGCPAQQNQLEG